MAARVVRSAAIVALMFVRGSGSGAVAHADTDLAAVLPAPSSLKGWIVSEGPVEYVPDNLYEYLDGGAERYISYGFRRLLHVRYQRGRDSLDCVTLDVFDMGGELGAFGIYRSVLPTGDTLRAWGAEGHRSGVAAAAWKSCVYVHAEADRDQPAPNAMLERLVAEVCDRTAGEAARPAILDPLPTDGLVPRSERYVARDLLGQAFLPGGVLAAYRLDGRQAQLFFSDLGSEAAAAGAIVRLRAHHERRGALVHGAPSMGAGGFRFLDPGLGSGTAVAMGRYVAGIHGDFPPGEQDRLLGRLLDKLRSPTTRRW